MPGYIDQQYNYYNNNVSECVVNVDFIIILSLNNVTSTHKFVIWRKAKVLFLL